MPPRPAAPSARHPRVPAGRSRGAAKGSRNPPLQGVRSAATPASSAGRRFLLTLLLLLLPLPVQWLAAEDAPARYFRTVTATNGTLSLEVAVRELVPVRKKRRPHLWLVGVIHLGETNYYARIQRFLDQQDLVFFEGIGATDGNFELQDDEFSLQDRMAAAMGLVFQLEAIDYHRPHFRNSDLGYRELAALFQPAEGGSASGGATGETGSGPGASGPEEGGEKAPSGNAEFNALVQIMEGRGIFGGIARLGVAAIAASPRLQATAKVMLIEMLGNLPTDLAETAGMPAGMQKLMEGLIRGRNEVVVRDVRRALRQRPRPRSIGIFYGAGHMADLEATLREQLGYRPGRERWFTAISIDPARSGLSRFELGLARGMARLQLKTLEGFGHEPAPSDGAPDDAEATPKPPPPKNAPEEPGAAGTR